MPKVKEENQVTEEQIKWFVEWLRTKQVERNATQDEMARLLKVSASYYNALINFRKIATKQTILKMILAIGDTKFVQELFPEEHFPFLLEDSKVPPFQLTYDETMALEMSSRAQDGGYITSVPVSPNLSWFGHFPNQIAQIHYVSDLSTLNDGQMVYVCKEDILDGEFMFVNILKSHKPFSAISILETPEAVVARYFKLTLNSSEIEEWGLDLQRIQHQILLSLGGEYRIHEVLYIIDILQDPSRPFIPPVQHELERPFLKLLIPQAFTFRKVQDQVLVRDMAEEMETGKLE